MDIEVASLSVLAPITITDAMLISSSIAENDYTAWSSATTYAVGDRVISATTHRIYESLRANNTNKNPTLVINTGGTTPYWFDVGPTNKWAMFDGIVSTPSTIANVLEIVLQPGYFNAVFFAGLDADTLTIVATSQGVEYYRKAVVLENSAPGDWYEYFFDRFNPQTDFLDSNVDQYNDAVVTITIAKASGTVAVGVVALGDLFPLGLTQYGARAKPKTFSYIKLDDFGNTTIKRRKKAKDMSATAFVNLDEANSILDKITSLLDVPCVWVGSGLNEYSGLRVFGLGSGELSYDHPEQAVLSINVMGLI